MSFSRNVEPLERLLVVSFLNSIIRSIFPFHWSGTIIRIKRCLWLKCSNTASWKSISTIRWIPPMNRTIADPWTSISVTARSHSENWSYDTQVHLSRRFFAFADRCQSSRDQRLVSIGQCPSSTCWSWSVRTLRRWSRIVRSIRSARWSSSNHWFSEDTRLARWWLSRWRELSRWLVATDNRRAETSSLHSSSRSERSGMSGDFVHRSDSISSSTSHSSRKRSPGWSDQCLRAISILW